MADELKAAVRDVLPHVTALRQELHAHPEPAYKEVWTSARIARELEDLGIPHITGVGGTGVVGWLLPDEPTRAARKAVLLRADMDALPIDEQTNLPYASTNGFAHACGHDGNMAVMLGAARVLAGRTSQLPRPVKFVFQPAEEGGAGAKAMIDDGVLTASIGAVEAGAAFAMHGCPDGEVGRLGIRTGPTMAGTIDIDITVTGCGGHGAYPHATRDPVVAAAQIILALQTIVSRNLRPIETGVVTIGMFHAGTARNVIPEKAKLTGTMRYFTEQTAELLSGRIEQIARQVAEAHDCRADVVLTPGYPVLVNAPHVVDHMRQILAEIGGDIAYETTPTMGAEDFAFFGQQIPSCHCRLGQAPAGGDTPAVGLHHPAFDFNDDALPTGIVAACLAVLRADELIADDSET